MDNPLISLSLLALIAFAFFYAVKYIITSIYYAKLVDALIFYAEDNVITEEEFNKRFDEINYTGNFLKWLIDWDMSNYVTSETWEKLKPYLF